MGKNGSLQNISRDLKGAAIVILINHTGVPEGKIESNEQSKEGGQPK